MGVVNQLTVDRKNREQYTEMSILITLTETLLARMKLAACQCLAAVRKLAVGPFAVAILTRTENGLLLVPRGDVMVGRRLSYNGRYDPELLDFLLRKCEAESEVLFVGAHVGALAIPVAMKVKRVVAVEANPAAFDLLRMNTVLNGLSNMEIHNFAAGDRSGEARLLTSELNSGGSSIAADRPDHRESYLYCNPRGTKVVMRRMDEVFPDAQFDLIVMDIEGSEASALRGMSALVCRSRGLLVEVAEDHLRYIGGVSNEEFLSLVGPHFDEAFVLAEKPRHGEPIHRGPYTKSAFPQMMLDCCKRRICNVMFLRHANP